MKTFKVWLMMVMVCLNLSGLSEEEKLVWEKVVKDGDMGEVNRVFAEVVSDCKAELVDLLIKAGADFKEPLYLEVAVFNGCFEVVKVLVRAGAEINDLTIGAAVVNNHEEIFNFLFKARNEKDLAPWWLVKGAYLGNLDEVKKYIGDGVKILPVALYYAVKEGKVEVVGVLLIGGVDVKVMEADVLWAAVNEGCHAQDSEVYKEILRMLLKAGVDPNAMEYSLDGCELANWLNQFRKSSNAKLEL